MSIQELVHDCRYAVRTMRRDVGFTAVVVLSLAVGIGANTAIFTFVNAALLKPLPYPNSERIVVLRQRPLNGGKAGPVHPRSYVAWQERAKSFESLAIAQPIPANIQTADGAEQLAGLWATPELFRVFGVRPKLGTLFDGAERSDGTAAADGRPLVVLSYEVWQRRFGSDPAIVGKTLHMERSAPVITGVLPQGFRVGSQIVDLYFSLSVDKGRPEAVGSRSFQCYGLLRPTATIEQAAEEMTVLAAGIGTEDTGERAWAPVLLSLRDYLVKDNALVLSILSGVVALVLLIACANVSGLLLTRSAGRRHELALRASIGAGRGRLIRQLLVESLVLAFTGALAGLLIGAFTSRGLAWLAKDAVDFGQLAEASVDPVVLLFTLGLALLTATAFGLPPALQVSKIDLQSALKERGRGATDTTGQRQLRSLLVTVEVALAVTLLIGAGLLLRTFEAILTSPLGFQPGGVVTMRTLVAGDAARRSSVVQRILERVETLPEVQAVGSIQFLPLSGFANRWTFQFLGRPALNSPEKLQADGSTISTGYLSAMRVPILRGRDFSRRDTRDSPRVALVNEAFVQKYLRGEDPLGLQIQGDWADAKPTEIVGVIGDIRHNGLTNEPVPTIFLSQSQSPGYVMFLAVRTGGDQSRVAAAIRREIRAIEPGLPFTAVQSMERYIAAAVARPRLYAVLVGAFASLALLLASVGVYGLISYTISRRRQEIGIRIALGAPQSKIIRTLVAHGLGPATTGLALGLLGAAALRQYLHSLLYGVTSGDPVAWIAATASLAAVALIAALVPAMKVLRMDPVRALRYD